MKKAAVLEDEKYYCDKCGDEIALGGGYQGYQKYYGSKHGNGITMTVKFETTYWSTSGKQHKRPRYHQESREADLCKKCFLDIMAMNGKPNYHT